jgi:hypothetical protein
VQNILRSSFSLAQKDTKFTERYFLRQSGGEFHPSKPRIGVQCGADLALLKADFNAFKDTAASKTDLALLLEQWEVTLHKELGAAFRSMAGLFFSAGIAIVAITLGGVYFLLTHWKP